MESVHMNKKHIYISLFFDITIKTTKETNESQRQKLPSEVRPAKIQISLRIRAVWSDSHWAHFD